MALPSTHAPAPPTLRTLDHLDAAWRESPPGARLQAVERAAVRLRAAIQASGAVLAVRTFEIARFPYPTRFAFNEAARTPLPYVWLKNRAVLVEYRDLAGARRRLLVNPTWPEGSKRAPYFKRIYQAVPGVIEAAFDRKVGELARPIPDQLRAAGIDPASIDQVTFDHLHVQDLGPLFGERGFYPSAVLLATSTELAAAANLHPLQRFWYVEGALSAVPPDRIHPFERDVLLGEGVALVRTPGHTEGNHTIALNLGDGLLTISENGVSADAYAPEQSAIPGLQAHARRTGDRVILNANSRERTLDQYTSMRLEAILAAPRGDTEGVPRHFPSSELIATRLAPGIRPTFPCTPIDQGVL